MSAADIVTCPGCGFVRPLEVVREALTTAPGPVLACWMVPTGVVPHLARRVAAAAARLERRGEVVLPRHLSPSGCGLVWCTVVGGRRVWAAEAEDIAEIVDSGAGVAEVLRLGRGAEEGEP